MSETGKTNALVAAETAIPAAIEAALLEGDVQRLKPEERTAYYRAICESVGLNWLTRPLDLLKGQDGKYRFYFRKEATDQLARANQISFTTLQRERMEDLYLVEVRGTLPGGRSLDDQGIVPYPEKATPTDRANAMMKATTKARRRVTLGLVGLGWQVADETQQGAVVDFSLETGALITEESVAENHTALLFGDHEAADAARHVEHYVPPPQKHQKVQGQASVKLYEDRPQNTDAISAPAKATATEVQRQTKQEVSLLAAANKLVRAAAEEHKIKAPDLWIAIEALASEGFDRDHLTPQLYGMVGTWAEQGAETLARSVSSDPEPDTSWMPEAELLGWIDSEAQERHVAPEVLKNLLTEYAEGWEGPLETILPADIPAWKAWAVNQWTEDALTGGA